MSSKTKLTKECGGKITSACASTTELHEVAKRVQHHTTLRKTKQKKCCIIQHLFSEKFDRDQTSYNKIQHGKTRYNKVAKRVQHFIKHQSYVWPGLNTWQLELALVSLRLKILDKYDGAMLCIDLCNVMDVSYLTNSLTVFHHNSLIRGSVSSSNPDLVTISTALF